MFKKISNSYKMLMAELTSDEGSYDDSLTPENALEKLKEYNNNPRLVALSQTKLDNKQNKEWLLNSFQFAVQKTNEKNILNMASYMNNNPIFKNVAPNFYSSSTWLSVISTMFEKSNENDRPALLYELEKEKHMQGIAKSGTYALSATFYFNTVTGHLDETDAKAILTRSDSFKIAKQNKSFAIDTMETYPQFKALL